MTAVERAWYKPRSWTLLFVPVSWLFRGLSALRKARLQARSRDSDYSVPVVVIGNINIGGTGKTPLIIALANYLQDSGHRPGIVSRGYGGAQTTQPLAVTSSTSVSACGDEALLISEQSGCPVVVCKNRDAAVRHLLQVADVDVVLSDDGLQHYAMARDIEVVVIDGARGLGNGQCLPAGPLREPPERLLSVDLVVSNGELRVELPVTVPTHTMNLRPAQLVNLRTRQKLPCADWPEESPVNAVAGIGHPQRFFDTLESLGIEARPHVFADHHAFTAADIQYSDGLPVIMTAKDAVKCAAFADEACWRLDVLAELPPQLIELINSKLV